MENQIKTVTGNTFGVTDTKRSLRYRLFGKHVANMFAWVLDLPVRFS